MNRRTIKALAVVFGVVVAVIPLSAHHPFSSLYDAEKVHNLKGVITKFVWANPHSLIFMETKSANGQVEHWALEVPDTAHMLSMGLDKTTFKAGDTLEVCGYSTKDGVEPLKSFTPPEPISLSLKSIPRETLTGQLISPEFLTLSSGKKLVWSKSQSKCVGPTR